MDLLQRRPQEYGILSLTLMAQKKDRVSLHRRRHRSQPEQGPEPQLRLLGGRILHRRLRREDWRGVHKLRSEARVRLWCLAASALLPYNCRTPRAVVAHTSWRRSAAETYMTANPTFSGGASKTLSCRPIKRCRMQTGLYRGHTLLVRRITRLTFLSRLHFLTMLQVQRKDEDGVLVRPHPHRHHQGVHR